MYYTEESHLLQFKTMFENPTFNLIAHCDSCAIIGFCSSGLIFTFINVGNSIQNASEQFASCTLLFLVKFALLLNKKSETELS
jgi:hypothetical protein